MQIRHWLVTLIRDEQGLATVEYALLLAGFIVGLSVTWQPLGDVMVSTGDETQQVIAAGGLTGVACR
ncbi:MAG: hypothetical protein KAW89_02355 [Armatimonadetes bacterium]|nr:hypothetical protein [Armatimonadota bacterium]